MASTSIHFPSGVLEQLDRAAVEAGVSRNKLVVEACRALLARQRRDWPEDFFAEDRLTEEEREELRAGASELTAAVVEARRSRREAAL